MKRLVGNQGQLFVDPKEIYRFDDWAIELFSAGVATSWRPWIAKIELDETIPFQEWDDQGARIRLQCLHEDELWVSHGYCQIERIEPIDDYLSCVRFKGIVEHQLMPRR